MSLSKKILTAIFLILIIITVPYLIYEWHSHTTLSSTDTGYVTKDIYNHYNAKTKIVLITGIHPREKLAINPEIESAKRFALTHNAVLINYNITVTKDAEDYQKSRYNGEHLVNEIVLPDIYENGADAVIISHSHIEGYGEGFYIATPAMDDASVEIAEKIEQSPINFNYFRTAKNTSYESTSIELTSKPLADAGYPTFVYEIPENITEQEATDRTYDLLNEIDKILTK